jgi:hypothetical protein
VLRLTEGYDFTITEGNIYCGLHLRGDVRPDTWPAALDQLRGAGPSFKYAGSQPAHGFYFDIKRVGNTTGRLRDAVHARYQRYRRACGRQGSRGWLYRKHLDRVRCRLDIACFTIPTAVQFLDGALDSRFNRRTASLRKALCGTGPAGSAGRPHVLQACGHRDQESTANLPRSGFAAIR